jgi:hypothetical protein
MNCSIAFAISWTPLQEREIKKKKKKGITVLQGS